MLDLSRRGELGWLARIVADIRAVVPDLDLLVVGALARDLWLHHAHGLAVMRATEDVDFALALSWENFHGARERLIASHLFEPTRVAHRLRHRESRWIDLIPFGPAERGDATIAWPPSGDEVMNVLGYAEANAGAVAISLPLETSARIVTLPMLAVLKIFAWQERHRSTGGKDAKDLAQIMRNYLDAGQRERLYSELAEVVTEGFDYESTAAWMLGRDARTQLTAHSSRLDRVLDALRRVLAPEVDPAGAQILVLQMRPLAPDQALRLLRAFIGGLEGREAP